MRIVIGRSAVVLFAACAASTAFAQTSPDADLAALLAENPDPFEAVDLKAVLENYGPDGSGIPFHSETRIALQLTRQQMISASEPLQGATGIMSDPTGFGFTIGLSGDYLFEFDKFDLTPPAEEALHTVLALHQEYGGTKVEISGHTDAKGSDAYNQDLSEKRANAVFDWFEANGIATETMTAIGYGETQPVAANQIDGQDNPEGRALNRRVDIKVTTERRVNSLPTVDVGVGLK